MNIKLTSIYWIAGLLDGEGSFSYSNTPIIQITLTDLDLLQKCHLEMKLNNRIYKVEKLLGHHREIYKFAIFGSLAIQWMMTLYPLLCSRRKARIKEVIKLWSGSRNFNSPKCINGHLLSGKNLILEYNNIGLARRCRICKNANHKRWKLNKIKKRAMEINLNA